MRTSAINHIICKYDKDLNLVWTYDTGRFITNSSGLPFAADFTIGIAVNDVGEVAYTQGGANGNNIKYVGLLNSSGQKIWEVSDSGSMFYGLVKCIFDRNGDIITSYSSNTNTTGAGVFKWSKTNGAKLWSFKPTTNTNFENYAHIACNNNSDDVFLHQSNAGVFRLRGSDGQVLWTNTNVIFGNAAAGGIRVNKNDEVYYFGILTAGGGRFRKLQGSNGNILLSYNVPTWGGSYPRSFELDIDNDGHFYTQTQDPPVVRKYREIDGVLIWTVTRGPNNIGGWNASICIYPQFNV